MSGKNEGNKDMDLGIMGGGKNYEQSRDKI